MRAIDLCDILKRNYKQGQFQCNMDSCDSKPCDLCTVEKFENEIRADERKKVLNEVIEKIKSGEYCSSSACKHYYEISDHFVDDDCTRECEEPIIEMIEQMNGEQT